MRESAGTPSRYRSVSRPCASGEKRCSRRRSSPSVSSRSVLDPAVQHRVRRLVDQAAACRGPAGSPLPRCAFAAEYGRDARVQRTTGPHRRVQRAHRLLERGVRVEAVRVEDVDVVQAHPWPATGRGWRAGTCASPTRRTARATCRSRPCVEMTSSSRYGRKSSGVELAEVGLGRAVGRAVVVRQVEVGDPRGRTRGAGSPAGCRAGLVAEVVPQAERHGRQQQAAASACAVGHLVVAVSGSVVGHDTAVCHPRRTST